MFWIHAATHARVEEGFGTIAEAVKLAGRRQPQADVAQLVHRWLADERNGRWLLVLDSADDADVFYDGGSGAQGRRPLATYLPQSRNGSIIVTTRDGDLARRLTGGHKNLIEMGPMTQGDAVLLLEKKSGQPLDAGPAAELVRTLDLVPLAISQAAAYIQARGPRSSIERYLAEFRGSDRMKSRLLGYDAGDLRRDGSASNAVLTTWKISFDHIRSKRPSAANLLALMSFFNRQGIQEELLNCRNTGVGWTEDAPHPVQWLPVPEAKSNDGDLDDQFGDDVQTLRDYSLIRVGDSGDVFEMHRLVQLSTRKWLEAVELHDIFQEEFLLRVCHLFPCGDYENWPTCQRLFAHAESALSCQPAPGRSEEAWALVAYHGAWYAWSQGWYDVAERMSRASKKLRESRWPPENKATLAVTTLLSRILIYKGQWEEGEKLLIYVIETRKKTLGIDHLDVLNSEGSLAAAYVKQGRWAEAEELGRQILPRSKSKLGNDHPFTATVMFNLSTALQGLGRTAEAGQLQREVLEINTRIHGPDHPSTLGVMNNLALALMNQGRPDAAERIWTDVLEVSKTKLGPGHPDTLNTQHNLGWVYWKRQQWDKLEEIYKQVLEQRQATLGVDHPDTRFSMAELAFAYMCQDRWGESIQLWHEVLEKRKMYPETDHPGTVTLMTFLASAWKSLGRDAEALSLMKDCAETRRRLLGPEHRDTLAAFALVQNWSRAPSRSP